MSVFKQIVLLLSTVSLLSSYTSLAQAAGDPVKGKVKAAACAGCHGADGNSQAPNFPKLSGQYADYIVKQVNDFLHNKRSDPIMSGMAATAGSAADLADIAAFFASQKTMKGTPVKSAKAARGKIIQLKGDSARSVYACVHCHGKNGKGASKTNPFFPVIGGQHKTYLVKMLKDFKSKKRTNDPAGMMAAVAMKMSDADIDAVAEYLSGL